MIISKVDEEERKRREQEKQAREQAGASDASARAGTSWLGLWKSLSSSGRG